MATTATAVLRRSSSSPSLLTAPRRNRVIRFDLLQIRQDHSATIVLSPEEVQAMWWSRSETKRMKLNARRSLHANYSQLSEALKRLWLIQSSTPAIVFFENIRMLVDRSCLEGADFPLLYKLLLSKQSKLDEFSPELSVLNGKMRRKMHGVRRVIHVQSFLDHHKTEQAKKAELLRITSLYHSEPFTRLARLIGQVDAMVASESSSCCWADGNALS